MESSQRRRGIGDRAGRAVYERVQPVEKQRTLHRLAGLAVPPAARRVLRVARQHRGLARAELARALEWLARRARIEPALEQRETQRRVRVREIGREADRALGRRDRRAVECVELAHLAVLVRDRRQRACARGIRCGVPGVGRDRRVELRERLPLGGLVGAQVVQRAAAQVGVVGLEIPGPAGDRRDDLVRCAGLGREAAHELERDRGRDLALHDEDVAERPLENLRPAAEAGATVDDVHRHAHVFAGAAHLAVDQVGDAELVRDAYGVLLAVAELARRGLRHDLEAGVARQRRAQFLREAIGKIALVRAVAHVHEWQHRDAGCARGAAAERAETPHCDACDGSTRNAGGDREHAAARDPGMRSDCGRSRRDRAPGDHCDPAHNRRDFLGVRGAAPPRQVHRVVLAKSERRLDAVERDRHELAQVTALPGFVEHPVGGDRPARPANDDRRAALERRLDRLGKSRAALDERVEPDVEARRLERGGQPPSRVPVGPRIAQEHRLPRINIAHAPGSLHCRRSDRFPTAWATERISRAQPGTRRRSRGRQSFR